MACSTTTKSPALFSRCALAVTLFLALSVPANAKLPRPRPHSSPAARIAPSTAPERLLWDAWYTMTLNDGTHFAYYNERAEMRGGKLYFQQHMWRNEEGIVNEEQVGTYSEDNADLTPALYNYHANYRATEINIDGTVTDGKSAVFKARKGGKELPVVKRILPSRTIFSVAFPLWLKRNVMGLKVGDSKPITTLFEDQIDDGFPPATGRVTRVKGSPKDPAKIVVLVEFDLMKSYWVLNTDGIIERIELTSLNRVVEKVSREKAEAFLTSKP